MAASQSLLLQQPTIYKVENHLYHHPLQFRSHTFSYVNTKNLRTKFFKNLISVKSLSLNSSNNVVNDARRSSNGDSNQDINKFGFPKLERKRNHVETPAETLINVLRPLLKPAATAAATVVLGLLLLMLYNLNRSALAATGYSSYSSSSSSLPLSSSTEISDGALVLFGVFLLVVVFGLVYDVSCKISKASVSVIKLQVGLLGLGRSIQKDFKTIAKPVDKSTSQGLHYILTELVVALLRYPENCISASLSIDVKWFSERAQQRFDQLSLEERIKFDEEILVNVNSIRKRSSTTTQSSGVSNEHMVLTILVMAQEKLKLPRINNSRDLKEVLQKLGCLPHYRILKIMVLWTPEIEDDTLSEEELLENYPLLRPLQ